MNYRLNKKDLLDTLRVWNKFLNKKIHLIACGGTALTLLGIKESTKDVDFMVPIEGEYNYLINELQKLGYTKTRGSAWSRKGDPYDCDLFVGNKIFTTELLESPLKEGNNTLLKEFSHMYLGTLNCYDLIISKLFRSYTSDIEDCRALFKAKKKEVKIDILKQRFLETAQYEISEEKQKDNLKYFLRILKKEKLL